MQQARAQVGRSALLMESLRTVGSAVPPRDLRTRETSMRTNITAAEYRGNGPTSAGEQYRSSRASERHRRSPFGQSVQAEAALSSIGTSSQARRQHSARQTTRSVPERSTTGRQRRDSFLCSCAVTRRRQRWGSGLCPRPRSGGTILAVGFNPRFGAIVDRVAHSDA